MIARKGVDRESFGTLLAQSSGFMDDTFHPHLGRKAVPFVYRRATLRP